MVEDDEREARALSVFLARHDAICAVACSLAAAKARWEGQRFDAAIVDLGLPDGSGRDVVGALRGSAYPTASVIVSGAGEPEQVAGGLRAGATDYVVKPWEPRLLQRALEHAVFSTGALRAAVSRVVARDERTTASATAFDLLASQHALSPRQAQVLKLVLDGLTYPEVGQAIQVTARTAKLHVQAVFHKLGVASREELFAKLVALLLSGRAH